MFTSFAHATVPMRAWFFDKEKSAFASKSVFGWTLSDSGNVEAVIFIPNGGVAVRAQSFADFVAVLPSDSQPIDAADEVAAGLVRVIGKEAAEAWRAQVGGVVAPKLAAVPAPAPVDVAQVEA